MELVFFVYGLAFFVMGVAVALETRRTSGLAFGRHLTWLAAFGFTHSLVEWADLFIMMEPAGPAMDSLTLARTILLPASALCLVRFGAGLVSQAGPLPDWLTLTPLVLLVPGTLLIAYALTLIATRPPWTTAADVWSRYLLYFPGYVLAGIGFLRQRWSLDESGLGSASHLLLGAAAAFFFNAVVAGLIVPRAPYGLAPWLNYENVAAAIGVPVQVGRALAAVAVTILVLRALGVFEAERQQQMERLRAEREEAQAEMLAAHAKARETAERWTEALVQISRKIASLDNVDTTLGIIVDRARELLAADLAALALWDERQQALLLKAVASERGIETGQTVAVQRGLIVDVARSCQALGASSAEGLLEPWHCSVLQTTVEAAGVVPLCLEEGSLGALWVARITPHPFTDDDLAGLEHLGDQAVIAIEHALLAGQLQTLAVTEERERIAREMHDGLSQILGYLGLEIQTLEALVQTGDEASLLEQLREIRRHINEAYVDVRENILSLRTTLSGDKGLISALGEYIDEFGVYDDTEITLVVDALDPLPLSPLVEVQLIRIVQEALTNMRKHAQARHTQVKLSVENGWVYASIADDGVGWDGQLDNGHFGLQMMRERAESVGGTLTVASDPGQGTQVTLRLPTVSNNT